MPVPRTTRATTSRRIDPRVKRLRKSIGFILLVATSLISLQARAASPTAPAAETTQETTDDGAHPRAADLRYSLPVDLSITAAAAGAWIASEALKSQLAPLTCRWCSSNALDGAVRTHLRWTVHGGAAVTISNAGAYAIAPLVALGGLALSAVHERRARDAGIDLLIAAEAVVLAGDLSQAVKYVVGRQRPYARAGVPNPDTSQGADDSNLSFFSGHTSFTFAIAAAAGTVAHLRGYRWARAIYVAGAAIGAATAYLRIAADQHYLTDVVTGAVVGSAVGAGVPWLHRPDAPAKAFALVPAPLPWPVAGGGGLGLAAIW
jgi:membrane-associated phospholipid phosphatase